MRGDAHAAGAEPPRASQRYSFSVFSEKPQQDFQVKIDPWSIRKNFQSNSWSRFANKNRGSIWKRISGSDFHFKIGDRFSEKNRIPILRSVCIVVRETVFQSRIDFKMKFGDRFWSGNRWSILIWKSDRDQSGSDFQSRSWSRWKFSNQGLMKFFQSKFAQNFSIKVWLKKVKHLCTGAREPLTTECCIGAPVFSQSLLENFSSGFDWKWKIKAWLKNKNQSLIDPDQNFNRDLDRDEQFQIKVCL